MSITNLADVREQFGDEDTDSALDALRALDRDGVQREDAVDALRVRARNGDAVAGIAAALLVRSIVDYEKLPPARRDPNEPEPEVKFAGSLGEMWKLQAALKLSYDDSNGLEILQSAVIGYLADFGISDKPRG